MQVQVANGFNAFDEEIYGVTPDVLQIQKILHFLKGYNLYDTFYLVTLG